MMRSIVYLAVLLGRESLWTLLATINKFFIFMQLLVSLKIGFLGLNTTYLSKKETALFAFKS